MIPFDDLEQMLHKGMGRAILYLKDKDLTEYRDLILDNCLHNRAYDRQCEYDRAEYPYQLVRLSSDKEFYVEGIVDALRTETDEQDLQYLYELAYLLAKDGHETARLAMYERFPRCAMEGDNTGASELVKLDGIDGLLFVLRQLGQNITDNRMWEITSAISDAEEQSSAEDVSRALRNAADDDPRMADLMRRLEPEYSPYWSSDELQRRREQKSNPMADRRKVVDGLTWEEMKAHNGFVSYAALWARLAPYIEFEKAALEFLAEDDPKKIKVYLRMFWQRSFPLHPQKLIDLVDSPDETISGFALSALSNVEHDEVRALFHRLYEHSEWAYMSVRLLESNYRDGDHLLIEKLINSETDSDNLHSVCFSTIDIYTDRSRPEATGLLLLAYEKTPCTRCRYRIFELLDELGNVPDWMIEECLYDAYEETRLLAREILGKMPEI